MIKIVMQNYKKALEDAELELATVGEKIDKLKERYAQLETTIAGLKSLMGSTPEESDDSMSDVIRKVLEGSGTAKFMGIGQIIFRMRVLGIKKANRSSVVTILNRLARSGEIVQGEAEDGTVGYRGKTMAERSSANEGMTLYKLWK